MGIQGTAAEARYRQMIERLALKDTCSIIRVATVKDAAGGWTRGPETIYASGIPCRVDQSQTMGREQIVGGRQIAEAPYTVSLSMVASRWPGGVVLTKASDRLVVSGSGAGTYEATADGGPTTDEYLRAVPCTKIG